LVTFWWGLNGLYEVGFLNIFFFFVFILKLLLLITMIRAVVLFSPWEGRKSQKHDVVQNVNALCCGLQQAAISTPFYPTHPTSAWGNRLLAYPQLSLVAFYDMHRKRKQWALYSLLPEQLQAPGSTRAVSLIYTESLYSCVEWL